VVGGEGYSADRLRVKYSKYEWTLNASACQLANPADFSHIQTKQQRSAGTFYFAYSQGQIKTKLGLMLLRKRALFLSAFKTNKRSKALFIVTDSARLDSTQLQGRQEPPWGPRKTFPQAHLGKKFLNFAFYNGTVWCNFFELSW